MGKKNLYSIILVNYNGETILPDCLNSIDKCVPQNNCEIILVDNASQDGSVKLVSEKFTLIKIVKLSKNWWNINSW